MVDAYIRFFACVRWSDHREVLELFRTLRLYTIHTKTKHSPNFFKTMKVNV